jgi:uncharacterized protein (DUF488 family)
MSTVTLFTIGFTRKSAERFFTLLCEAGVRRVLDVRLHNVSQLAGFAKKEDLRYFLRQIGNIDYMHLPELAPTQEILDEFKKNKGDWAVYQKQFLLLLKQRRAEERFAREIMNGGCLLCSEENLDHCHRRLIAEYLRQKWGGVEIKHLF